jgi:ribosome biogenesis ATPase
MNDILQQIRQVIEYPLIRPELYSHLGVDPPRRVLLRGPPGCGKSHLANAIAGQMGLPFFRVSAPELVSGMSGESEGRIRDLFQAASDLAPSLIF